MTWDYAKGVQASETDPNGISISRLYDNFGRRTQENRPDGTDTTWSYNDCVSVLGGCQGTGNKLVVIETARDASDAAINDRWTYLDRFDRAFLSKTKLLSGNYDRSELAFDALGRVAQRAAPTWWVSPSYYWTTYQYDLLNRPTQESRPVSDTDPTLQTSFLYYEGLKTRILDPQTKEKSTVVNVLGAPVRSMDHTLYYQSFDYDAFGNPVRVMDSSGNTLQTATFNVRGMRTSSTDLDMGSWIYVPNALGELASQTDANAKQTTLTYDWQSRPLTRIFPEGAGSITATWSWGQSAASKNIGKLASSQISGTGLTTYTEAHSFDSLGRPSQTQYTEGATAYTVNVSYGASTGFIDTLTYPTSTSAYRLKLQYDYQYGHLLRLKDFNAPTTVFWLANTTDARGAVIDETLGNGLRTTKSFDAVTGLAEYIRTGPGGGSTVQNLSYLWDKVGNLTQRQDGNQSLTENFFYDDLYRLDSSQLNGSTNLDLSYNSYGNILTKTQAGVYSYTYTYHATKIHAATSITGTGPAVGSYVYDAAGNMTSRLAGEITWFASNLPKRIRKTVGSTTDSSEFQYAPSGMRWRHAYRKGSTLYTHVYVGSLLEKVTQGTNVEWKHSIHANGQPVALLERHSNATNTQWYVLKDHLGSTDVIANSSGGVFVRESNDAFGKRRGTAWTGAPTATQINNMNTSTRRGFTFHEHLDSTDLIHMNGRMYDPAIGRFVSADPTVPYALSTQSHNRYSYTQNNPLSRLDLTGFTDAKDTAVRTCDPGDCTQGTPPPPPPPNTNPDPRDRVGRIGRSCIGNCAPGYWNSTYMTTGYVVVQAAVESGYIHQASPIYLGSYLGVDTPRGRVTIECGNLPNCHVDGGVDLDLTPHERRMISIGGVREFYESRAARGDSYGDIALSVLDNRPIKGMAANLWLFTVVGSGPVLPFGLTREEQANILAQHGTYIGFVQTVSTGLAEAHADVVADDFVNQIGQVPGLLSQDQIRTYHERFFESLGLPRYTFTGTAFPVPWCFSACDSSP